MNTFKMQCVNYLLVNGWVQDLDGWEWTFINPGGSEVNCSSLGCAVACQLEWDDEAGI